MACVSVGKQSCSSDETRTPYQIVGGFFFFVQRNKYCKELCECGLTLRISLCSISVGIISNRECICACACTDAFSLFLCILNALKKTLKIIISEIMANNIKPSEWSHRQFLFSFPFRLLLTGINLSETIPETFEFEQIVLHCLKDSLLGCVYKLFAQTEFEEKGILLWLDFYGTRFFLIRMWFSAKNTIRSLFSLKNAPVFRPPFVPTSYHNRIVNGN